MKTHTKTTLFNATIVSIGLFCATSFAAPEVSSLSDEYAAHNTKTSSASIDYSYAYPSITSEIFEKNSKLNIASFAQVSDKPFLGINVVDFSLLTPNKAQKKNSIFEFAAKFNDKLQQVLAFFSLSKSSNANQMLEEVTTERELGNIQINRNSNQHKLQENCSAAKV
jgi:hypothetical protein